MSKNCRKNLSSSNNSRISIRLTDSQYNYLLHLEKVTGCSPSVLVRNLIDRSLADYLYTDYEFNKGDNNEDF